MLSIHYVSIMMRIFYIDWQQHWECHRTVNIGDQQNSHKWQTSRQLGFQWHRRGIELVFKSLDCFTKRLFHTATIFCCYICICCLKLHQADYKVEECFFSFFLPRFGGGPLSSNVFTICAVFWSLGRRGYFKHFKRRSCNCYAVYTIISYITTIYWEYEPMFIHSLWPSDTIFWHRSGSTWVQVMACCLTAPSHYLNQCWLIISKALWHSSEGNFTGDDSAINTKICLKITNLKLNQKLLGANELKLGVNYIPLIQRIGGILWFHADHNFILHQVEGDIRIPSSHSFVPPSIHLSVRANWNEVLIISAPFYNAYPLETGTVVVKISLQFAC